MPKPLPAPLAAAVLAFLVACTPPPGAGSPPSGSNGPGAGGPAQGGEALVTTLEVETYADSVRFVFQVTNPGSTPVQVTFPSGQTYDFVVRQGGRELWRWSGDMGFTQAVRQVPWAAGETARYTEAWRFPVGTRGELTAEAVLASSSHPVRQTTTFRLP